jgi:hypothetical protein
MTILVTVRPGPVMHIWQDGKEIAAVPLSWRAAIVLASDLLREIRRD